MAERDAKATVPEVRFPEFVDAQNWSVAPMRKLYAFMRNNLLSRDKLNYERGVAKNIHYGDIHTKFQALFDELAQRYGIALIPFLLDGVAGDPALTQDDGLHPRAEGQQRILDNVWPTLEPLLRP